MPTAGRTFESLVARLAEAGCVAAGDEAGEFWSAAGGPGERLENLLERRCEGEPLAWLTGEVRFAGERVLVVPGVYVPRWQSEPLATEAATLLPETGVAVDLCTGSGALAVVLARRRPRARVVAGDIDPLAVACARSNGVEAYESDMAVGLPAELVGRVDVVTAVVPYVPTDALALLPRDVRTYEPRLALDGGRDGLAYLARAAGDSAALLRVGGSLLLELGAEQGDQLAPALEARGYGPPEARYDEDGDLRAVACRLERRR
jgi:release factor glutamine methyltransferase